MSKSKNLSAGVAPQNKKKAGPVDPKGAYTKVQERTLGKMKMGGKMAKSGGSFPDLNKDGKITKADILKGRGVIAKKGASVKKAMMGTAMSDSPMMKKGGSMKKCKYGCK
jgi:hypothetical protein